MTYNLSVCLLYLRRTHQVTIARSLNCFEITTNKTTKNLSWHEILIRLMNFRKKRLLETVANFLPLPINDRSNSFYFWIFLSLLIVKNFVILINENNSYIVIIINFSPKSLKITFTLSCRDLLCNTRQWFEIKRLPHFVTWNRLFFFESFINVKYHIPNW